MANFVRICKWDVRVNSLWLWWYCLLVVIAEAYLMYRAVSKCREYNELPWQSAEKPVIELYVYIGMIVISIMCIPFFVITTIFKIGNYANDGLRLGRDDIRENSEPVGSSENGPPEAKQEENGKWQSVWCHLGPLSNTFHVAAAFTLLLPKTLLQAREIQHLFLTPDYIWRTELDVIFGHHFNHKAAVSTDKQSGNMSATMLPSGGSDLYYQAIPTSPEYINFIFALLVYSMRYGAVFWYTKMCFSLVFSFHLIVTACHYVFSYCTMAMLYKMQINHVAIDESSLILPPSVVVTLHVLASLVMFTSAIAVFNYGCAHYNNALKIFIRRFRRVSRKKSPPPTGCQGYVPHTMATVSLVLVVVCRGPIVYDCVTIYRNTGNTVMLAGIVWDVAYMIVWIVMWFVFTLKQYWDFQIVTTFSQAEPTMHASVYTIHDHFPRDNNITVTQAVANHSVPVAAESQTHSPGSGDSPPNSPPSALRQSGRKQNNARVTFGGVSQQGEGGEMGEEQPLNSRNSSKRRSRDKERNSGSRKHKKKKDRDTTAAVDEMDQSQPPSYDDASPGRNAFHDQPKQETPENTLTRNYRHSIRDKCGQYYRNSREFKSPPAAQSSPVLRRKMENRDSHKTRSAEVAENLDNDKRQLGLGRPLSEERPSRYDLPLRAPMGAQQRRTSSAERIPLKHAMANDPHRRHALIDYPSNNPAIHHNPRTSKNISQQQPTRAAPSRPVTSKAHRDLNRELEIVVSKKPEMGRRDSALPSSNETSSNDSNDNVLCSQV